MHWALIAAVHSLCWLCGASVIRACEPKARFTTLSQPHLVAAYFLGLLLIGITSFCLNTLAGVRLTPAVLLGIAVVSTLWPWALAKLRCPKPRPPCDAAGRGQADELPGAASVFLAVLIACVYALRHAAVFWVPLSEWDSFLYHMPFGRAIAQGDFPAHLGRSYIQQIEAAYPPLFYFLYGINAHATEPWAVHLMPKLTVLGLNASCVLLVYSLARSWRLGRVASQVAALLLTLVINVEPNMQSLTTVYVLLGVIWSQPFFQARRWRANDASPAAASVLPLVLGCIAWAGAYWANYIGLVLLGLFFLLTPLASLWHRLRSGRWLLTPAHWAACAALVLLLISPHLIRNTLATGNPIFPGFLHLLGGKDVTPWFLANAPPVIFPITTAWRYPHMLMPDTVPLSHLACFGALSLCALHGPLRAQRLVLAVMIVAFLLYWLKSLIIMGPSWRYLFPVVAVGCAACVAQVTALWRRPRQRDAAFLVVLGIFAGMLIHARFFDKGGKLTFDGLVPFLLVMAAAGLASVLAGTQSRSVQQKLAFRTSLVLVTGVIFVAITWPVLQAIRSTTPPPPPARLALAVVLPVIALGAPPALARLPRPAVLLAALACAAACLYSGAQLRQASTYTLPPLRALLWINGNLPRNAVVLTGESRLFHLDRAFMPVDDRRMEPLYLTEDLQQQMAILQQAGITHIYYSYAFDGWQPLNSRAAINPKTNKQGLRVLWKDSEGWVAELVYAAEAPATQAMPSQTPAAAQQPGAR